MSLPQAKNLIYAFAIVLVAVVSGFLLWQNKNKQPSLTPLVSSSTQATSTSGQLYNFRQGNFVFVIPPGWVMISSDQVQLPQSFGGLQFALKKEGTTCVLAYVRTTNASLGAYTQTSFADRVYGSEDQFDSSWYTPKNEIPQSFVFNFDIQHLPFPHEVRPIYYPVFTNDTDQNYSKYFLLFDQSGSAVSDQCNAGASALLATLKQAYDSVTLTSQTSGILYIVQHTGVEAQRPLPQLLFVGDKDPIVRQVTTLDADSTVTPTVYNNELYFVNSEGTLKRLDVFSQQISDIPGLELSAGETVNNFYFYKNNLFYLAGPACNGYLQSCNSSLIEYDFTTEHATVLASGVTSRVIAGYDPNANKLDMYYADGDAGCFGGFSEVYDFASEKIEKGTDFGGCEGDNGLGQEWQKLEDFQSLFQGQVTQNNYIQISNGILKVTDKKIPSTNDWWTIDSLSQ